VASEPRMTRVTVFEYEHELRDVGTDYLGFDAHGHVPVPQGPGLGVQLDWEWIRRHEIGKVVYE
jgi:L-alanine-DL-glutamate epimerase-like enolase superfamily enzyme